MLITLVTTPPKESVNLVEKVKLAFCILFMAVTKLAALLAVACPKSLIKTSATLGKTSSANNDPR